MPHSDRTKFPYAKLAEIVSVGFPFCAFKVLSGLVFRSLGNGPLTAVGGTLITLGILDVLVNAANFSALALRRRPAFEACTLALLTRIVRKRSSRPEWNWQELGNSLDVLLAFILVALTIGFGFLKRMTADELLVWNVAVILNVLGAGLTRFGQTLRIHWVPPSDEV